MQDPIITQNSGYITLQRIEDARDGVLCVGEVKKQIPFEIKRIYYVTHLENAHSVRGKHAHKTLSQVIFCLSGSFVLELDDGQNTQEILMWQNHVGVFLGPKLWHSMANFSSGCVLLVVASDYYDEADYMRNYDQFLEYIKNH
ncbi:MAG: FdtA/QdtA family cupin domain-containing protein [bacterium]